MKYNEKFFYQSTTEPFETQEMSNGAKIEMHYMDEEPFYMENINKSRFLAWSSADGKNYKVFVDKGLYEETTELYTKDVNEIWMNFLIKIDQMRKKYMLYVLLPVMILMITGFVLLSIFLPNQAWILIVAVIVLLISSLFASAFLSRKMQIENINAAARVREHIGVDKFKEIVDRQDKYMEKYYDDLQKKYEEEDRLAEEAEKLDEIEEEENEEVDEAESTKEE